MDNLELIDLFFKSSPGADEKQVFEERILNDPSFADDVAFYLSTNDLLKQELINEKKNRFREIYKAENEATTKRPIVKMMWRYMAAASILGLVIISSLLLNTGNSPAQMADKYTEQNWKTLSVVMDNSKDDMQLGIALYNDGKFAEALASFETIIKNDSTNTDAKKYAGIAAMRCMQYTKAAAYFASSAKDTTLHSNPGKFYQAIALLKSGSAADQPLAKRLLQEVVAAQQEGSAEARVWLKKWH